MKKFILFLLVLSLTACSNQNMVNEHGKGELQENEQCKDEQFAFQDIPSELTLEEMINKGFYIAEQGVIYNAAMLEQFLSKEINQITIAQYTIEGDIILTHIKYQITTNDYLVILDTTRDSFGENGYYINTYQVLTLEDNSILLKNQIQMKEQNCLGISEHFIYNTIEEIWI